MNVSEFLTDLTRQDIQVWVDNDKLNIRSPKGIVTPELRQELAAHKADIIAFLSEIESAASATPMAFSEALSLQTIGRLIGGFSDKLTAEYKPPVIDSRTMAQNLTVTFRPLPPGYNNERVLRLREQLELKLRTYGVKVLPWDDATTDFAYEIDIPLIKLKKKIKMRVVKVGINAVIDVARTPSLKNRIERFIAEKIYEFYSRFVWKDQQPSIYGIGKIISWAEEHAAKYIQDPMNTQVIIIADLDRDLANPELPYQQKIKVGLNTLIKNFSELVIGVDDERISVLNMNLSDSVFPKDKLDCFILNTLVPKIFVPIMPLPMSRFEIGYYEPSQSTYAEKLVALGQRLAPTGLFPAGSQISKVVKRKSYRDIVNIIMNGRTGVSYGFVAYAEPPHYIGKPEITEREWENLFPIEGFRDEVRKNELGRRYIKTKIGTEFVYKQIPDIWLVSSRSGSNKTDLSLERDILRIGLKEKLFLQLPQGANTDKVDLKPSYDLYVMMGIALSAALYAPQLIKDGTPIIHFHGYPAPEWFGPNEYCSGTHNPSVPCGTYESGVFNFLGIYSLANQYGENMTLASLIEPDHGANFIASDMDYLLERLETGLAEGQIELGGKHFNSLKAQLSDR